MENNHQEHVSEAPKQVVENREKDREFWRRHRSTYRLVGALIAIIVAIIIFLAGVVFGRLSTRFSGGYVNHGGYGRMQMQGGHMGGYGVMQNTSPASGSTVSPAHPITPLQPTPAPTSTIPVQ